MNDKEAPEGEQAEAMISKFFKDPKNSLCIVSCF